MSKDSLFVALENALANGQLNAVHDLLSELRELSPAPAAFDATVEGALAELEVRRDDDSVARFVARISGAFDPDCDL